MNVELSFLTWAMTLENYSQNKTNIRKALKSRQRQSVPKQRGVCLSGITRRQEVDGAGDGWRLSRMRANSSVQLLTFERRPTLVQPRLPPSPTLGKRRREQMRHLSLCPATETSRGFCFPFTGQTGQQLSAVRKGKVLKSPALYRDACKLVRTGC